MASERYLLGEMTEHECHQFEAHFFDCQDCAEDVRRGALLHEEVRAAARQAPVETTQAKTFLPPGGKWKSTVLPWAVAAALAMSVGYQSLVTVPTLRSLLTAQAISPVILRPASRGEPTVVLSEAARPVSLAMDVDARSPDARLSYVVRRSDGAVVVSNAGSVPRSGLPLILFLQGQDVPAPGEYAVLLTVTEGTRTTTTEYPFQVTQRQQTK